MAIASAVYAYSIVEKFHRFRKVCRQCGAKLVMVPRLLHPSHMKVYVAGFKAMPTALFVRVVHLAVLLAGLVVLVKRAVPDAKTRSSVSTKPTRTRVRAGR
jgi:hypothetical protein